MALRFSFLNENYLEMTNFATKLMFHWLSRFSGKSKTFNPVFRDMKCSGFWKNCRETGTSEFYNTSFMSSCHHFVALYKMHFCLCRNFGVMTSSYGHNKMHSFLRGNLNVLYNIQMIRLWTNHIQFRMRYRKIMWSNVPNVPNPSWQCFCSETMKKLVFVVWRFHVCPNDWQLNQFHINPKREMHNLSTSASKTTISFKLCSRVFNWILFSWIFLFCSLSDRINLWWRTNRWSRSDNIYPTSVLSPIADMKHTCTAWNSWLENQQIKVVIASQFLNWVKKNQWKRLNISEFPRPMCGLLQTDKHLV